jgi:hypothetical protein
MQLALIPQNCITITNQTFFGICDNINDPQKPTFIDTNISNINAWDVLVENNNKKIINFIAIDNCFLANENIRRCDCALDYDDKFVLIEIKKTKRKGSKWITDAESQIISTLEYFKKNKILSESKILKAYISNKQKPYFRFSQMNRMDNFIKQYNCLLRIENKIVIQ